jgi:hypothetical protein
MLVLSSGWDWIVIVGALAFLGYMLYLEKQP